MKIERLFLILLMILFVSNYAHGEASVTKQPLKGKIICLDPGHQQKADLSKESIGPGSSILKIKDGGGASGISSRVPEERIVLDISLKLKKLLEEKGAKVIMTRVSNDIHLGNVQRANIANKAQADIFIRIHCDGNDNPSVAGTSVLYPAKNSWTSPIYMNSKLAADCVQKNLVRAIKRKDKGITPRGDITGFNWSRVPVILVETAFLSNPAEDKLLNNPDFRERAAQGICWGIEDYFQKINKN